METIFRKPLILNGEEGNVVLVYSKYIIGNIKKEIADLSIEVIDEGLLNPSRFESIVKIKEIFAYKFKPGSDSCITFVVKNVTGTSFKTIDFKDIETTKEAELTLKEQFGELGFRRKEKQLTSTEAAIFPLIMIMIISVIGGGLTWFSYVCQKDNFVQTKAYSWCFYMFARLCNAIGYIPFLVIAVTFLVLCFFWLFKRILNPPYQISAVR